MNEVYEFLGSLNWSPLWISIKTGAVATVITFLLGIFTAWRAMSCSNRVRAVLDGLLTLPMVLPPTVAGFFLLLIFSRRRAVGMFLDSTLNIQVIHTWLGCVLAAVVIAFPLMYRNARAAFEQLNPDLIDAGRTLGMSERAIFWRVVLPTAAPGIASGAILTMARAMGEYGATSMVAGNIPGRTATISQQIALVIQNSDYATAGFWVAAVIIISLILVYSVNIIASRYKR